MKKEYELATKLCAHGLQQLEPTRQSKDAPTFVRDLDQLRSDFHFLEGKVQHQQDHYQEALACYSKSLKCNPQHFPALFCLGKVQLHFNNFQEAEHAFEAVVNAPKHKDCYEALKLLGQTKARQFKVVEAVEVMKRVIELNPNDYETNIEIAQLFEQNEPKHALVYYETALKIMSSEIE